MVLLFIILMSHQRENLVAKILTGTRIRAFVVLLVAAACLLAGYRYQQGERELNRIRNSIQNVVLISIDTCRADRLSCYGYSAPTTPNIDRLADQGVLFLRAQSTNPITLPSHCSMLTGTIPPYHGVRLNMDRLSDADNETLAEILQRNGFRTGAVLGAFPLDARFGLNQGFDSYDANFGQRSRRDVANQRKASEVSQLASDWLEKNGSEPFFLFLHYFDPHGPYEPPAEFSAQFSVDRYVGEIAYTDSCIGQVVDRLRSLGLLESTLIVVAADHGESLGEHQERTHAYFAYQSTIHVPLIMVAPTGTGKLRVEQPVSIIDIVPTILSLLGVPVPPQVQGADLSAYLSGGTPASEPRYLYSESWDPAKFGCCPLRGLLYDNWHYIWSIKPELYDIQKDPGETENVVGQHSDVSQELHDQLQILLTDLAHDRQRQSDSVQQSETVERLQALGYVGGRPDTDTVQIDEGMEDPKDFVEIYLLYVRALYEWGRDDWETARARCLKILDERPDLFQARFLLGDIAFQQGNHKDAVAHYSSGLTVVSSPTADRALNYLIYKVCNNLAWIHATSQDPALYDTERAVRFAEEANRRSGGDDAGILDTLAVAQAAAGNFEQAVETVTRALTLSDPYAKSTAEIRKHLHLFQQSKPYRNE